MESKKMKSESVVPGEQKKTEFALGKTNIILIAVAFVVIVVGFLLMLGPGTTPEAYNPDIFSFRRIVLAPGIALQVSFSWSMRSCVIRNNIVNFH